MDKSKQVERVSGRRRLITTEQFESDALHKFTHDPDWFVATYGGEMIKDDNTSTVLVTSFDGRKIVVKRYNNRNVFHPFKRALRKSRAEHSFNNALLLKSLSIPTPQPVAAIEERIGPLRGRAWFLSLKVEGELLTNCFDELEIVDADNTIVKQLLEFFDVMRNHGFSHGDMKATNLLVCTNRLIVLDLDGMRSFRSSLTHRDRLAKDARRFIKNWQQKPKLASFFQEHLESFLSGETSVSRNFRQRFR